MLLSELSRRFARFALLAALMLPVAVAVTACEGEEGAVEEGGGSVRVTLEPV